MTDLDHLAKELEVDLAVWVAAGTHRLEATSLNLHWYHQHLEKQIVTRMKGAASAQFKSGSVGDSPTGSVVDLEVHVPVLVAAVLDDGQNSGYLYRRARILGLKFLARSQCLKQQHSNLHTDLHLVVLTGLTVELALAPDLLLLAYRRPACLSHSSR